MKRTTESNSFPVKFLWQPRDGQALEESNSVHLQVFSVPQLGEEVILLVPLEDGSLLRVAGVVKRVRRIYAQESHLSENLDETIEITLDGGSSVLAN